MLWKASKECTDIPPLHPASLPQHPPLTDASGYLVVVAPGAVWLADCGRQLFGGEPVAAVAEVGHPCADGVISSEHTSVHRRDGHTAWHSCRRQQDDWWHTFMRSTRCIQDFCREMPAKQAYIYWTVTFLWACTHVSTSSTVSATPLPPILHKQVCSFSNLHKQPFVSLLLSFHMVANLVSKKKREKKLAQC